MKLRYSPTSPYVRKVAVTAIEADAMLVALGATIDGAGTSTIRVEGTDQLSGTHHRVPPDRIETGTFLAAAAATRGEVRVVNTEPDFLHHVLGKLEHGSQRPG